MTGRFAVALVAGLVCFRPVITIGQTAPAADGDTVRVFRIDPPLPLGAPPSAQGVGSGLFDGFLGGNVAGSISGGPLTLVLGPQDDSGVAQLSLQSDVTLAIDYLNNGCTCLRLLANGSHGSIACRGGFAYDTSIVTTGAASWTVQTGLGQVQGYGNGDLIIVMALVSQIPDQSCDLVDCNTVDYPNSPQELPFTTTTATAWASFQEQGPHFSTTGAPFDCTNFGVSGSGGAFASGIELNAAGNVPRIHTLRLSNAEPDLTPTSTATVPSPTSAPATPTDTPPVATTTPLTPTSTPIPTATSLPAGPRVQIDIGSAEGMPGDTVAFSVGITVEPVTSILSMSIMPTDTAIPLVGVDNFPSVPRMSNAPIGTIRIDNELITYTGISGNSLIGVTRGFGTSAAVCAGDTPPAGCPAAHNAPADVMLEGPVAIENEIGFSADAPIVADPNMPFRATCTGVGGSFTFQPAPCGACTKMLAEILTGIEILTASTLYTCSVAISPTAMAGQAFPLSCSGAGLIAANATDSAGAPLETLCTDGQIIIPEPTAVSTPTDTPTTPAGATPTETEAIATPTETEVIATPTETEVIASPTMPTSTATSSPSETTPSSPAIPTETPTAGGAVTATPMGTIISPTSTTGIPTHTNTPTTTASSRPIGTSTPMRSATEMALTPTVTATGGITACIGDCHGTGAVAIGDLITLVNIALGNVDASTCSNGIPSGAQVDIALIIRAVNSVLNGCPA